LAPSLAHPLALKIECASEIQAGAQCSQIPPPSKSIHPQPPFVLKTLVCLAGFAPQKQHLTAKLQFVKFKFYLVLPLMQRNSLTMCRLLVSSLHGCCTHICAPRLMSHFHGIAPFFGNIRACWGAKCIFFYPKCLANVRLFCAPCLGLLGCVLACWGA